MTVKKSTISVLAVATLAAVCIYALSGLEAFEEPANTFATSAALPASHPAAAMLKIQDGSASATSNQAGLAIAASSAADRNINSSLRAVADRTQMAVDTVSVAMAEKMTKSQVHAEPSPLGQSTIAVPPLGIESDEAKAIMAAKDAATNSFNAKVANAPVLVGQLPANQQASDQKSVSR